MKKIFYFSFLLMLTACSDNSELEKLKRENEELNKIIEDCNNLKEEKQNKEIKNPEKTDEKQDANKKHSKQDLKIGMNYEGGKIIYIFQPGDNGYVNNEIHGYIIAEKSITKSTNGNWENVFAKFNCSNSDIKTSTSQGKGFDNTNAIIEYCAEGTAAHYCNNLKINGFDDWFLPSKDELAIVYNNYKLVGGVYPIKSQGVWSSSSHDSNRAYVCSFDGNGNWVVLPKTYGFYIKPLRKF